MTVHDVVIVGAGAMGSAAAWALTRGDRDVVVFEQYELGHDRGGSHGATRIFRVGTEQAHYLKMAERARALWRELENETATRLLTVTGALEHGIGQRKAHEFGQFLHAQGIGHELIDEAAATGRWPGMLFDGPVLHQYDGGILHADRAVAGLQRLARQQGAQFRAQTRVDRLSIANGGDEVVLDTAGGTVRAKRAVVTVGSWAGKLLRNVVDLPPITITQEQPRVFEPLDPSDTWPCFVHWRDEGGEFGGYESYGLLEAGVGVKVGLHASGPVIDPDMRDFTPEASRDETLRAYVRRWFPGLDADRSTAISCLYDNTDNGDFVIDTFGPITLATGFNGEGFKFVPYIGELLSKLVLGSATPPAMFTLASHIAGGL